MKRYGIGLAIFLSGFINLSAELLFQRILFQLCGHGIRTQSVLFLSFILGCGIGALAVTRFRFRPAWIELSVGVFNSLFSVLLITGSFYQTGLYLGQAFVLVLPSGFALGSLLPLYAAFAERRYASTYAIFHCGAVVGLFGFEFWILNTFSYSFTLLALALWQILFGLWIWRLRSLPVEQTRMDWVAEKNVLTKILVFTAVAFYLQSLFAVWLTEIFGLTRINLSLILLALMGWQSFGAWLVDSTPWKQRFLISLNSMMLLLAVWVNLLPLHGIATIANSLVWLIAFIFLLCLVGTSTSMIAASYFSEANNQKPLMYTGWTSFISSIGSLIGGGLFYLTSNVRIEPIPAVTLLLAFVFILLVGSFPFSKTHAWMLKVSGILLLAAVGWNFRHINIGDVYTKGRYAPKSLEYTENKIWAAPDSIHALVYARDRNRPWVFNYIDGHLSHELTHFHEVLVGLLGQQFFDQDVERSLIIGIGSGQTLSGLLEWSRHVDAIDLSQNPISAAKSAPEFNNDVMNNPRKTTFTMDGIQFIKSCQVESYDFILLTPTPIGLLHSTKLFSKEFLTGAKRCLKPDGILMTWFDGETIRRQQLLASIFKTTNMVFRNMALSLSPYPILFLSDVGLVKVADIEKGLFNEKIEKLAKAYNQGIYLIHFDAEELLPALRNVAALTLDSAGEAYWAEVDYYRKLSNPARPNTLLSVLLSRMFRSGYLPHQAFLERQEKLLSRYF